MSHLIELRGREDSVYIGPDREEGHITEVEQPGEADHDVQADRQPDVELDAVGDGNEVAAGEQLGERQDQADGHQNVDIAQCSGGATADRAEGREDSSGYSAKQPHRNVNCPKEDRLPGQDRKREVAEWAMQDRLKDVKEAHTQTPRILTLVRSRARAGCPRAGRPASG